MNVLLVLDLYLLYEYFIYYLMSNVNVKIKTDKNVNVKSW